MRPERGSKSDHCPCCEVCTRCTGFQKVLAVPDAGYVLYRHTTRVEDINKKTGAIETTTDTVDDVFIIENTEGNPLEKIDVTPAIDPSHTKCPRCVQLLKHAQKLLKNQDLGKSDIIGICEHCRKFDSTCVKCEEAVQKFQETKKARKHNQAQQLKTWLSKIQKIIKISLEDKQRTRAGQMIRRHSDVDLNNLLKQITKIEREPDINDLFLHGIRDLYSKKRGPRSEQPYYPGTNKDNEIIFYDPSMTNDFKIQKHTTRLKIHDAKQYDTGYFMPSNITLSEDELEKDFIRKYGRSYKEHRRYSSPVDSEWSKHEDLVPVPGIYHDARISTELKKYHEGEREGSKTRHINKKPKYFAQHGADAKNEFISIPSAYDVIFYKDEKENKSLPKTDIDHNYRENKELLIATDKLPLKKELEKWIGMKGEPETKIIYESPTRVRKYRSEDSLLTGLAKMKDYVQNQDTFQYYFPERKKIIREKSVSSSELIKDTLDKLKTKIEEERRKREEAERLKEERRKNLEREKKERKARILAQKMDKIKHLISKESLPGDDNVKDKSSKDKVPEEREPKYITTEEKVSKEKVPKEKISKEKEPKVIAIKEKISKEKAPKDKVSKDKETKKMAPKEKVSKEKVPKEKESNKKEFKEKESKEKIKKEVPEPKNKEKSENPETKIKEDSGKDGKVKEADVKEEKSKVEKSKEEKGKMEKSKEGKAKENKVKEEACKDKNLKNKEDLENEKKKRELEAQERKQKLDQERREKEIQKRELQLQREEEKKEKLDAQKAKEVEAKLQKALMKLETPQQQFALTKILNKPTTSHLVDARNKFKKARPPKDMKMPRQREFKKHMKNHGPKISSCDLCIDSDYDIDVQNALWYRDRGTDKTKWKEAVIGSSIYKYTAWFGEIEEGEAPPALFHRKFDDNYDIEQAEDEAKELLGKDMRQKSVAVKTDQDYGKGVIRYALSNRAFIDKGWTKLPTEKVVRKMNVYRMRPAHPEFDWFDRNKKRGLMTYDTGEKLAEFDENGRGRWFYRSGLLALDYYNAEEMNAQQRFVVYSSGERDARGRSLPRAVLAAFDYLGNGIVFDHTGKIRLKYNQTEGIVLDRALGPASHWKWHTLNDPPVLQQVMIDTQMSHKDPHILKLGGPVNEPKVEDEDMLAIEFDNFIKEKSEKLTQTFKPFQIKMKALKINEYFSLRVLDQANVYLIFRDGATKIKLNIGMILDNHEIIDTDTAEVGQVSSNLERFPAKTDSLAELQANVADAQRIERVRFERDRRINRPQPVLSVDRLKAAASKPIPRINTDDSKIGASRFCPCRKPSNCNVYYNTGLV